MLPPTAGYGAATSWGQLRQLVAPHIAAVSRAAATTCAMGNGGGSAAACWVAKGTLDRPRFLYLILRWFL